MTARIDTIVLKGMTNLSPLLDKDVVDEDAHTSTLLPPRCIVCFLPSLFMAFVIVIGYELFVLFTIFDFFDFTVDDAVDGARRERRRECLHAPSVLAAARRVFNVQIMFASSDVSSRPLCCAWRQ